MIPQYAQSTATKTSNADDKDDIEIDCKNNETTTTEDANPNEEVMQHHKEGPADLVGHGEPDGEAEDDPDNDDNELRIMKARTCAAKLQTFFRVRPSKKQTNNAQQIIKQSVWSV